MCKSRRKASSIHILGSTLVQSAWANLSISWSGHLYNCARRASFIRLRASETVATNVSLFIAVSTVLCKPSTSLDNVCHSSSAPAGCSKAARWVYKQLAIESIDSPSCGGPAHASHRPGRQGSFLRAPASSHLAVQLAVHLALQLALEPLEIVFSLGLVGVRPILNTSSTAEPPHN